MHNWPVKAGFPRRSKTVHYRNTEIVHELSLDTNLCSYVCGYSTCRCHLIYFNVIILFTKLSVYSNISVLKYILREIIQLQWLKNLFLQLQGTAAFWYNLYKNGEGIYDTRHAACPVLVGSKWVSNKWIHERGQEFRRPCGLKEEI